MSAEEIHDDESWRDDHAHAESETRGPLRLVHDGERPREPWEIALLAKLLCDKRIDKKTGDETYTIRPCAANVATILQHHPDWAGVVAQNVFHLRIEATRVPPWHPLDAPKDPKPGGWTAADDARLVNWLARTSVAGLRPINVSVKAVEAAVIVAAEANKVHPPRDYLLSLPAWDGTPRLEALAKRYLGGEDKPYARDVGVCFMIGAVARIMQPGCKHDSMVVFEGEQGRKKSTAAETLAGQWFADSKLPIGSKDAYQQLAGVWIYEIGELAGMSKADVEEVKAFLSSRKDRYRPSYERYAIDVPRQTVFVGTTNTSAYLHDVTGGRRFYPLRTGSIDIEALRRDRDQLWAEALHRFRAGEPWWLESDHEGARAEQDARFVADEWEAKVKGFVRGRDVVSVAQILEELIFEERDGVGMLKNSMGRWGQREQNRVARCLQRLGWKRQQVRVKGGGREWRYVAPVQAAVTGSDDEAVT